MNCRNAILVRFSHITLVISISHEAEVEFKRRERKKETILRTNTSIDTIAIYNYNNFWHGV
jgi:hypothetical protein